MKFNEKINHLILSESTQQCTMFWCMPIKNNDGFKWDVISFKSKGDDLSNWLTVLFELKRIWEKDFNELKDKPNCLPRGILSNGYLYHGNNLPMDLFDIAKSLNINLGDEHKPVFNNKYGVSAKSLEVLNNILGVELNIPTTDMA